MFQPTNHQQFKITNHAAIKATREVIGGINTPTKYGHLNMQTEFYSTSSISEEEEEEKELQGRVRTVASLLPCHLSFPQTVNGYCTNCCGVGYGGAQVKQKSWNTFLSLVGIWTSPSRFTVDHWPLDYHITLWQLELYINTIMSKLVHKYIDYLFLYVFFCRRL